MTTENLDGNQFSLQARAKDSHEYGLNFSCSHTEAELIPLVHRFVMAVPQSCTEDPALRRHLINESRNRKENLCPKTWESTDLFNTISSSSEIYWILTLYPSASKSAEDGRGHFDCNISRHFLCGSHIRFTRLTRALGSGRQFAVAQIITTPVVLC